MTIGRMQMNKQLYGIGSKSLSENGRDRFGLGSFIRKTIPNEISNIVPRNQYGLGSFVSKAFKGVTGAVKSIASSPIGQIALAVAAPYALGYLAPGFATLGGSGMMGAALRGGISNAAISALSGQKINPKNVLLSAGISGGLQGYQSGAFGGAKPNLGQTDIPRISGGDFGQFTEPAFNAPGTPISSVNPVSQTSQLTSAQIGQEAAKTFSERTAEMSLDSAVGSGGIEDYLAQTAKNATSSTPYADAANKILSGNPSTMWEGTKSLGKEALTDIFYKDGKLDKPVALAALSGAYSYYDALQQAKKLGLDENSYTKEMYEADVASNKAKYQANLPYESFGIQTAANGGRIGYAEGMSSQMAMAADMIKKGMDDDTISSITQLTMDQIQEIKQNMTQPQQKANGGRIGYKEAGMVSLTDQNSGVVYRDPKTGEPLTIDEFLRRAAEDEAEIQLLKEGEEPGSQFISRPDDAPSIRLPEKGIPSLEMKAGGGRMGYMMGTEVPMRQNQGGISELDYRKTGGFVPVGVKEKADDVPAMLSKNEFVFTADAVKAAGGGSVSKGAQKMYKLMKSLEGKFKGKKIRA